MTVCLFTTHYEGTGKKKTERVRFGVSSNRQGPVPRQKAATSAKDGRHGHRSNCHLPRLLLEILMRLKQERPTDKTRLFTRWFLSISLAQQPSSNRRRDSFELETPKKGFFFPYLSSFLHIDLSSCLSTDGLSQKTVSHTIPTWLCAQGPYKHPTNWDTRKKKDGNQLELFNRSWARVSLNVEHMWQPDVVGKEAKTLGNGCRTDGWLKSLVWTLCWPATPKAAGSFQSDSVVQYYLFDIRKKR